MSAFYFLALFLLLFLDLRECLLEFDLFFITVLLRYFLELFAIWVEFFVYGLVCDCQLLLAMVKLQLQLVQEIKGWQALRWLVRHVLTPFALFIFSLLLVLYELKVLKYLCFGYSWKLLLLFLVFRFILCLFFAFDCVLFESESFICFILTYIFLIEQTLAFQIESIRSSQIELQLSVSSKEVLAIAVEMSDHLAQLEIDVSYDISQYLQVFRITVFYLGLSLLQDVLGDLHGLLAVQVLRHLAGDVNQSLLETSYLLEIALFDQIFEDHIFKIY